MQGLPSQWNNALGSADDATVYNVDRKDDMKFDTSHKRRSQSQPPSPLQDTPTLQYTVATGDNGAQSSSPTVLDGHHSVKQDGLFTGWIWKDKWLVLGPHTLTIYKSKVHLPRFKLTTIINIPLHLSRTQQWAFPSS